MINDTLTGAILEQFDIEIAGYLHPGRSDFDEDWIMDGVEMGLLVIGTDTIDYKDIYGNDYAIQFPLEEIGWWMIDEGTGTAVNDFSYNENNGTMVNMEAGDWKSGKIGDYSLEFDGVDEYITIGDDPVLNFERNQSYSLAAWVKTSSADGSIMSKMNVSNNYRGYDMYLRSNGVIRAHLINALDSNEIIVDGSTSIDDGEWHLVVITYNGSSSASGVQIYIDGSLDNITTVKDTLNKTIQTEVDFRIGSRTDGNYFSGQIDDTRVYDKALSQEEITWLSNYVSIDIEDKVTATIKKQTSLTIPSVAVSGTNVVLYVFGSAKTKSTGAGNQEPNSVVWDSGGVNEAFTQVGFSNTNKMATWIYRLVAPTAKTADITISDASNNWNWDGCVATALVLSGVHQTTPDDGYNSNDGTSGAASVSITSETDDMVFDVVSVDQQTPTVDDSQTEQWNSASSGDLRDAGSSEAGATSISMDWTFTSTIWGISGININPTGSGDGQPSKTLNSDAGNEVETQIYLEIPHVGRVYDANLTLQVESIGTSIGNGTITISSLLDGLEF